MAKLRKSGVPAHQKYTGFCMVLEEVARAQGAGAFR